MIMENCIAIHAASNHSIILDCISLNYSIISISNLISTPDEHKAYLMGDNTWGMLGTGDYENQYTPKLMEWKHKISLLPSLCAEDVKMRWFPERHKLFSQQFRDSLFTFLV